MLAELGIFSLFLTFAASIYAVVISVYGSQVRSTRLVTSGRNAALLTTPLLFVSLSALFVALITEQYQISYVHSVTDPRTPMFYRITALWGAQQGSLLFWSFTMSLFTAGAILINWNTQRRLMPYVIAFMMVNLAFFVGLSLFLENPFERYWVLENTVSGERTAVQTALIPTASDTESVIPPAERALADTASGLNPLLRHFGMIIHPPMLYLGFVGFIVPYAFAMAALASGNLTTDWIKVTRKWTLVAWLFLSLGLLLGGRWAYDVLGWGGYWGWDPVENAAFLPWLMGTAFLHSVMVQERRGMLKVWNMFLVIATYTSVIFGTFATRSGLIESVHSFARSEIGMPMFFFWGALTLISVALILWRWNRGELKDEREFANILSRESMFVLNNIIFMALFVAIFWGSFGAPIASELFAGTEISIGADTFNRMTAPMFAAMYVLMGIAPLTAWGVTSRSKFGRLLLVPGIAAIVTHIALLLAGLRESAALVGYTIVVFAGYVALYEIYRGAKARRKATGEGWFAAVYALFVRSRRRYGGYIIHIGIVIIGIGVIGSTLFQFETQRTLQVGETLPVQGYDLTFEEINTGQIARDGRVMDIAQLNLSRNGQDLKTLRPRQDLFQQADGQFMPMTIASAHSTAENDFYVLLVGWEEISPDQATFKIYINPLINFVWLGGVILILGTMIAAYPEKSPQRARQNIRRDSSARATA
ncbi:MAG: cytochrome c-type biogenesis CcmF C-terminal domain-containing protein [Chloroflexota bacterium]